MGNQHEGLGLDIDIYQLVHTRFKVQLVKFLLRRAWEGMFLSILSNHDVADGLSRRVLSPYSTVFHQIGHRTILLDML